MLDMVTSGEERQTSQNGKAERRAVARGSGACTRWLLRSRNVAARGYIYCRVDLSLA